jgi:glycine cleavage system H protein
VSGRVVETNPALKDHPQLINEDPFGKGWIVKIAVRDKSELKGMFSAKDYKKSLPEE